MGMVWLVGLLITAGIVVVMLAPNPPPPLAASSRPPAEFSAGRPAKAALSAPPPRPASPTAPADCSAKGFERAAQANEASLTTLVWKPFHRDEIGWEIYAPRIAREIGAPCPPESSGFAETLARWQGAHRLPANGQMDATTFGVMNNGWELARPFVRLSQTGVCPAAPAGAALIWVAPEEGYSGKPVQLRPGALAAYRQLVAAARAASPAIDADHRLLTIFSGYRSPEADTVRCARDNDCGNITRALCSSHRTGLAVDLYLGAAPGHAPESSDDVNRLYQSRSPAYAWLIANAARYGFVNYPFEPWHWEWTGEPQ
jgi:hypothetical protein